MPAKKAGTASLKSLHSISLNEEVIITPTATRAGAVAANGTALTKVARKADTAKQMATITEVSPVRPPAPIPEALSTKVVVFEVPNSAPIEVAVASANRALSSLYGNEIFLKAKSITKNHEDAEELTQDTMMRIRKGIFSFRGDSSLKTWIFRIINNLSINRLKKTKNKFSSLLFSYLRK